MTTQKQRASMARAFRETALILIGLYRVYEVDPDLADATAEALGHLFRRHLRHNASVEEGSHHCAMHAVVDEIDRVLAE